MQSPAGNTRQRPPKVIVSGLPGRIPSPEHHWIQLSKRQYCVVCCIDKIRLSIKKPLAEIDGNGVKRRRKGAQTSWGCSTCLGAPCCKNIACWEGLHA